MRKMRAICSRASRRQSPPRPGYGLFPTSSSAWSGRGEIELERAFACGGYDCSLRRRPDGRFNGFPDISPHFLSSRNPPNWLARYGSYQVAARHLRLQGKMIEATVRPPSVAAKFGQKSAYNRNFFRCQNPTGSPWTTLEPCSC